MSSLLDTPEELVKTEFSFYHFSNKKTLYTWHPNSLRVSWVSAHNGLLEYSSYRVEKLIGNIKSQDWIPVYKTEPCFIIEPSVESRIFSLSGKSSTHYNFCFAKLVEEVGEVAKAINQPERASEPLENEIVDVIIVAMDMLNKVRAEKPGLDLTAVFNLKLDKWESLL